MCKQAERSEGEPDEGLAREPGKAEARAEVEPEVANEDRYPAPQVLGLPGQWWWGVGAMFVEQLELLREVPKKSVH